MWLSRHSPCDGGDYPPSLGKKPIILVEVSQDTTPSPVLDSIPGIDKITAMTVLSEISAAPKENFQSAAHLCSWAGLAPRNDESAGKIKSRKIMPGNQYIKTILCQAAWGAVKVRNSSFSKWFWSHQGHIGQKKAIIAVSRKLLKMIYILLEKEQYYDPNCAVKATE